VQLVNIGLSTPSPHQSAQDSISNVDDTALQSGTTSTTTTTTTNTDEEETNDDANCRENDDNKENRGVNEATLNDSSQLLEALMTRADSDDSDDSDDDDDYEYKFTTVTFTDGRVSE